jgi:hypothetical protein
VIGQVRLWGKVIECERGWRAALAYPERLYVPMRPADERARRRSAEIAAGLRDYGVPVEPMLSQTTVEVLATARWAAA